MMACGIAVRTRGLRGERRCRGHHLRRRLCRTRRGALGDCGRRGGRGDGRGDGPVDRLPWHRAGRDPTAKDGCRHHLPGRRSDLCARHTGCRRVRGHRGGSPGSRWTPRREKPRSPWGCRARRRSSSRRRLPPRRSPQRTPGDGW